MVKEQPFFMLIFQLFIIIFISEFKLLRVITLFFSFLLILGIINFNDTAKKRVVDLTLDQMGISDNSKKKYIFSEEHQDQYFTALNMFKDKPLFGAWIKKFRVECSKDKYKSGYYPCSSHPHNIYIQLLSETGIMGFIIPFSLFIFICIKLLKHLIYQIKKKALYSDLQICLLSSIFITLWPIAPNGNMFNNWLSIIYYIPVGIFLWTSTHEKKKN